MSEKTYPFWQVASHTFLLGAGASRAAFPKGDKFGHKLPLMCDFIEIVGLEDFFKNKNIDYSNKNIEDIYDGLFSEDPNSTILSELNELILSYFNSLTIPDEVTLYDELLLTLQKKDAIFSFNWDPLLLQAFIRNIKIGELPDVHFLHGNVLTGICEKDHVYGHKGARCSKCNMIFSPSKILFPIKKKNYNQDPFIKYEWEALNSYLNNSFLFTIFGYSAPKSDIEAREIMFMAWNKNKRHELNQINIIDIKSKEEIEKCWADFICKDHRGRYNDIRNTQSFRYPRRSCESFGSAIMQLDPWQEKTLPRFKRVEDLQEWILPLVKEEIDFRDKDIPINKYV